MKRCLIVLLAFALAGCRTTTVKTDNAGYKAGVAKVKITPLQMTWLSGYGGRSKPAQGVTADLWARAVALRDANGKRIVVVSLEVLGLPNSMNQSIRAKARKRFGLRDDQLMLVATHTHKGPVLPDRPSVEIMYGLNAEQKKRVVENAAWLEERILEVIGQSLTDLVEDRGGDRPTGDDQQGLAVAAIGHVQARVHVVSSGAARA